MVDPQISVCIPTMDRFDTFLHKYIPLYLENPHINEIIICDENGNDYEKINKVFSHEKLFVFKNESKLGALRNKFNVGSRATSEYVCILDSDNFADESYFVAFKEFIRKNGPDPNTIYSPSVAGPFNFTNFIGKTITKDNISFSGEGGDMSCLLNTMNFIISKVLLNIVSDYMAKNEDTNASFAADAVYFNMIALCCNDFKFEVIPGMTYDHVVHDGSYFTSTAAESTAFFNSLKHRFNKY